MTTKATTPNSQRPSIEQFACMSGAQRHRYQITPDEERQVEALIDKQLKERSFLAEYTRLEDLRLAVCSEVLPRMIAEQVALGRHSETVGELVEKARSLIDETLEDLFQIRERRVSHVEFELGIQSGLQASGAEANHRGQNGAERAPRQFDWHELKTTRNSRVISDNVDAAGLNQRPD